MTEILIAVAISVFLSTTITYAICLKQHEMILDYYQKYMMRLALNEVMIESLLRGKNKQQLLDLYERTYKEIEEGEHDNERSNTTHHDEVYD